MGLSNSKTVRFTARRRRRRRRRRRSVSPEVEQVLPIYGEVPPKNR
jgi:hypothetical protein